MSVLVKNSNSLKCLQLLQLAELTNNIHTILEALKSSEVVEIKVRKMSILVSHSLMQIRSKVERGKDKRHRKTKGRMWMGL